MLCLHEYNLLLRIFALPQVENAQNGGATAVIIMGYPDEHPFNMVAGQNVNINIPAVMVGNTDGQRIRQSIGTALATIIFDAERKEILSSFLPIPGECNRVRSPSFVLNANSSISIWVNFGISGTSDDFIFDRANVGLFSGGKRVTIIPDDGHKYNSVGEVSAEANAIEGCPAPGVIGWRKRTGSSFVEVIFSSEALQAAADMIGEFVQLDIALATGLETHGSFFSIKKVELANVGILMPDEGNLCSLPSATPSSSFPGDNLPFTESDTFTTSALPDSDNNGSSVIAEDDSLMTLTLREEEWLDGHNTRREKYHKQYGKTYRPLKWSTGLKEMAQEYVDKLASDCGPVVHESYENRGGYGENLSSNSGFGSWGELKPVDVVMTRWVEREQYWAPPDNVHYMQVLWRSSTHVGCADSVGTASNGAVCRYQVCRYASPGNCDMDRFNDGSEEWWMEAVLNDQSSCQPFCPPEGCRSSSDSDSDQPNAGNTTGMHGAFVFLVIFILAIPLATLLYVRHKRRKEEEELHRANNFSELANPSDLENPMNALDAVEVSLAVPVSVDKGSCKEFKNKSQSDGRNLSAMTESLSFSSASSEAEDDKHDDDEAKDQNYTSDDMVDDEGVSRMMSFLDAFVPDCNNLAS